MIIRYHLICLETEFREDPRRSQDITSSMLYAMPEEDLVVIIVKYPLYDQTYTKVKPLKLSINMGEPVPSIGEIAAVAGWGATCYEVRKH